MSGSSGGDKPLKDLTLVSSTTGLRILGFSPIGVPFAVEPNAFAQAPGGDVALSSAVPLANNALGSAGLPGSSTSASRADHRHPMPTATDVGAALASHSHAIAEVSGLQAALDAKANATHTHNISGVNGLQAALDGKASIAHSHAITDVTGLQNALDAKIGLATRGAANGVAPLDATGKVPAANLPTATGGTSNVNNGTVTGQIPAWNNTTQKYDPFTPIPDTSKKLLSVERNGPTVISFAEYNNRRIVLTANAPLSVAAAEAGQTGDQSLVFMVKNRHTTINTITFAAGITVDAYPIGTGSAGAVKIAAKGSITVDIYSSAGELIAEVRGQIV